MKPLLAPLATPVYALLRVVSGLLFACHGLQKVFGLFGGPQESVGTQMWIGGVLEITCGLAIAIGIFASLAAFIASGMMAVAYFQVHWNFTFDSTFFPIVNLGELAVVYCFLFLYIACRGSGGGMWSAEAKQRRD
jgi:putative oxidoreductase